MSAQDIFNKMNEVRPNHGLRLYDVEAFLANPANVREMNGMSLEEAARYICTVLLDVVGSVY